MTDIINRKKFKANLEKKLKGIVPDFEIAYKADIAYEINKLKREKNAVILGHNYMEPALFHSIPDYTGDSLGLCRRAAESDKDIIVFCGVEFMAETAKILNPKKTVLIPSQKAGCSLAESITAEDVRKLKAKYPGVPVVTYVNTYADVKAETDICCTSGNAVKVVESLKTDKIIFLPDEYLASNVAHQTGKKIIFPTKKPKAGEKLNPQLNYEMIGWHGKCEVHDKFTVEDINNVRKQFPEVIIMAHPECKPEVVDHSDFSGSTTEMINFIKETKCKQYLLLTECSMADNIAAQNKNKEMLRLCSVRCPYMNEITLEQTLEALKKNQYVINLSEEIIAKAKLSVERMIAIG